MIHQEAVSQYWPPSLLETILDKLIDAGLDLTRPADHELRWGEWRR